MIQSLGMGKRKRTLLLSTGQTSQYSSELDDGHYKKGIIKSYTILTTGAQSGTTNIDLTHLGANTGVSFVSATKEIDCAGALGVFKGTGSETIVITGSASNNGTFTTKTGGDGSKILVNEAITDEAAGASVTIAKREVISNNCVIDNNTGLMWARYIVSKMGIGGDGKMPWTGVPYDIFAWCSACNAAVLGGYSDWRVANLLELYSIEDNETPTSLPDSTAFPSFPNAFIYSSSTKTTNIASGLFLDMNSYQASSGTKTTAAYQCALVRG